MNKPTILTAPLLIILLTITCTGNTKESAFLPYNQLANTPVRKVISFDIIKGELGIVLNNEIRFFYWNWDIEDWKEDEGKTFSLPPNCKDVFFMMFHKMIYG